jgi:hypothetical protein
MELSTALPLFVALLFLASLLQRLAARTTLPASILLATAGALIGGGALLAERLGWGGPIARHGFAVRTHPGDAVDAAKQSFDEARYFLTTYLLGTHGNHNRPGRTRPARRGSAGCTAVRPGPAIGDRHELRPG